MRRAGYEAAIYSSKSRQRVSRPVTAIGRLFRALTLGTALVLLSAPVAQAAGAQTRHHLQAVKAVDAPAGFNGVCQRYRWACDPGQGGGVTGKALFDVAATINASVNRRVREVADQRQYNRREYWALPTSIGGDCEDFALLKKQELLGKGVAAERLLIATVLDRRQNPHAVLVLRTDRGDYVLDNLTNRMMHWSDTGYTFLRMQNPKAPGQWVAVFAGGVFADAGARLGA